MARRGRAWQGVCMVGDMCGRGGMHGGGGMCGGRGHAWWGACMAGGGLRLGRKDPPPRYYEIGSMSGRYAS